MKTSTQKTLLFFVSTGLTALLLGGAVSWYFASKGWREKFNDPKILGQRLETLTAGDAQKAAPKAPYLVRVDEVKREPITPSRVLFGRLTEYRKVTVAAEVNGRIVDFPHEAGNDVVGGKTVLAKIDDVWSRLDIEKTESQIRSKQAKLAFEKADLARYEELIKDKAASKSTVEQKSSAVDQCKAEIAELEALLEEQRTRFDRTTILAPFDGQIITKRTDLGAYVTPGSPLLDIISTGRIDAVLLTPESMIPLLAVGRELSIHVDALKKEFPGKIQTITSYGANDSRTFPVRIALDDQDGLLKVGMSVRASVPTAEKSVQIVVPKDAVLIKPDGSSVWVATPEPDKPDFATVERVPVYVTARMRDRYAVEVSDARDGIGLEPGMKVVIEGSERLVRGMTVKVIHLEAPITEIPGMYKSGQQKKRRSKKQPEATPKKPEAKGSQGDKESQGDRP